MYKSCCLNRVQKVINGDFSNCKQKKVNHINPLLVFQFYRKQTAAHLHGIDPGSCLSSGMPHSISQSFQVMVLKDECHNRSDEDLPCSSSWVSCRSSSAFYAGCQPLQCSRWVHQEGTATTIYCENDLFKSFLRQLNTTIPLLKYFPL